MSSAVAAILLGWRRSRRRAQLGHVVATRSVVRSLVCSRLPVSARKLLAFADNRQDASLQAGHFNELHPGHPAAWCLCAEPSRGSLTASRRRHRAQRHEALDLELPTSRRTPRAVRARAPGLAGVASGRRLSAVPPIWSGAARDHAQPRANRAAPVDYIDLAEIADDRASGRRRTRAEEDPPRHREELMRLCCTSLRRATCDRRRPVRVRWDSSSYESSAIKHLDEPWALSDREQQHGSASPTAARRQGQHRDGLS